MIVIELMGKCTDKHLATIEVDLNGPFFVSFYVGQYRKGQKIENGDEEKNTAC